MLPHVYADIKGAGVSYNSVILENSTTGPGKLGSHRSRDYRTPDTKTHTQLRSLINLSNCQ